MCLFDFMYRKLRMWLFMFSFVCVTELVAYNCSVQELRTIDKVFDSSVLASLDVSKTCFTRNMTLRTSLTEDLFFVGDVKDCVEIGTLEFTYSQSNWFSGKSLPFLVNTTSCPQEINYDVVSSKEAFNFTKGSENLTMTMSYTVLNQTMFKPCDPINPPSLGVWYTGRLTSYISVIQGLPTFSVDFDPYEDVTDYLGNYNFVCNNTINCPIYTVAMTINITTGRLYGAFYNDSTLTYSFTGHQSNMLSEYESISGQAMTLTLGSSFSQDYNQPFNAYCGMGLIRAEIAHNLNITNYLTNNKLSFNYTNLNVSRSCASMYSNIQSELGITPYYYDASSLDFNCSSLCCVIPVELTLQPTYRHMRQSIVTGCNLCYPGGEAYSLHVVSNTTFYVDASIPCDAAQVAVSLNSSFILTSSVNISTAFSCKMWYSIVYHPVNSEEYYTSTAVRSLVLDGVTYTLLLYNYNNNVPISYLCNESISTIDTWFSDLNLTQLSDACVNINCTCQVFNGQYVGDIPYTLSLNNTQGNGFHFQLTKGCLEESPFVRPKNYSLSTDNNTISIFNLLHFDTNRSFDFLLLIYTKSQIATIYIPNYCRSDDQCSYITCTSATLLANVDDLDGCLANSFIQFNQNDILYVDVSDGYNSYTLRMTYSPPSSNNILTTSTFGVWIVALVVIMAVAFVCIAMVCTLLVGKAIYGTAVHGLALARYSRPVNRQTPRGNPDIEAPIKQELTTPQPIVHDMPRQNIISYKEIPENFENKITTLEKDKKEADLAAEWLDLIGSGELPQNQQVLSSASLYSSKNPLFGKT